MPTASSPSPSTFTVLVVDDGNTCLSPVAERLGRAFVDEALGDQAAAFHFVSAGTRAAAGAPMDPSAELVLRGLGGDPAAFWAGPVSEDLTARADLTLTMTREQRAEVLSVAPRGLARTFTLLEAADLVGAVPPVPTEGVTRVERARSLVRSLAAARAGRRSSDADDIQDPSGRRIQHYQQAAELIASTLIPVLARLVLADATDAEGGAPGRAPRERRYAARKRRIAAWRGSLAS